MFDTHSMAAVDIAEKDTSQLDSERGSCTGSGGGFSNQEPRRGLYSRRILLWHLRRNLEAMLSISCHKG